MKTRVLKFGGSSFPKMESYREIARYLGRRLQTDTDRLVVVVSAMSGTTGRIQEAGLSLNPDMSSALTDSLLATGEMTAACLMRAALEGEAISATHFTGYQVGILTDSKHTRASVLGTDSSALEKAFVDHKVVVVAGGQAVNSDGQITMLGRNSSDLSAVILASMLNAGECEIFSDVPGVYTADPYVVPQAKPLAEVPYDAIITLSRSGAKVLHHGAVSYAKKAGVRIVCRGTGDGTVGSVIGVGPSPSAVVTNSKVAVLRFTSEEDRDAGTFIGEKMGIVCVPVDMDDACYLTVSQENRGWVEVLPSLPQSYTFETGRVLLTEMDAGVARHTLLPESVQKLTAREIHDRLHPGAVDGAIAFRKERGRETGLLVG